METLQKFSKVVSKKPAYKEKVKTDSGYVWVYDDKAISKRWDEKKNKLNKIEKNIKKIRDQYNKDLSSDDLRRRAEACIVSLMDNTAIRIGNEDSAKQAKTYGATTLKVKHVTINGNNIRLKFVGKDNVKQDLSMSDSKTAKVLKELIRGKKEEEFVFEIDGVKIWDRAVNRYLKQFDISGKDLRGFQANRIMKDLLKNKDWDDALEETAKIVGHEKSTLKNQYLMPELVKKYEKRAFKMPPISKRAQLLPEDMLWLDALKLHRPGSSTTSDTPAPKVMQSVYNAPKRNVENVGGIMPNVKTTNIILSAWAKLRPYLPSTAVMTSGFRTKDDQVSILNQFWRKETGRNLSEDADYEKVVTQLRRKGYDVGVPWAIGTYSHFNGNTFDISGANLDTIYRGIIEANNDPNSGVKFTGIIVERKQNNVHVSVASVKTAINKEIKNIKCKISKRAFLDNVDWIERQNEYTQFCEENKIVDVEKYDARKIINEDPIQFFYRGMVKDFPDLELDALKKVIENNAKFYFVFKYNNREEDCFKKLLPVAAELLSHQDARAFFYYQLHKQFYEFGRGAIVQLIDTNPDSYFDLGLSSDYPDYEESANNARNIKDPNKVELELDQLDKITKASINKRSDVVNYEIEDYDINKRESPEIKEIIEHDIEEYLPDVSVEIADYNEQQREQDTEVVNNPNLIEDFEEFLRKNIKKTPELDN